MWRIPLCAFVLAVPLAVGQAVSPAPYRVTSEWSEWVLGTDRPKPQSRAAVCPDGTVYVTNGTGRILAVDASGKIVGAQVHPAFVDVIAMACGADRLYVEGRSGLSVLQPGATGELRPISAARPDVPMDAIVDAGRGLLFAHGSIRGDRQPLHAVTDAGVLLYSFGGPPDGSLVPGYRGPGSLLWDDRRSRLLYLPAGRYEIQVYARDGRAVGLEVPGPQSWFQLVSRRRYPFLGEALGAARMDDGSVVVQVRNKGHSNGWPPFFLQVLDADLNVITPDLPVEPGILAGASRDGALYFFDAGQNGLLSKVRLTR